MSRLRRTCPCGEPCSRLYCIDCAQEVREVGQAMRWQPIHDRWADGWALDRIAVELGVSRSTIGVHVFRMRAAGWDMPYRREWCVPRTRAA